VSLEYILTQTLTRVLIYSFRLTHTIWWYDNLSLASHH